MHEADASLNQPKIYLNGTVEPLFKKGSTIFLEVPVIKKQLDETGEFHFGSRRHNYYVKCRRERNRGFSDSLWIIRRRKGTLDEETNVWISLDARNDDHPRIEYHSYNAKHEIIEQHIGNTTAVRKAGKMLSQIKRALVFQQPSKVN